MFEKYPNHRTIYMDVTNKPTNYDRCIRVEKRSKNYLSIMLFSKHEVTNVNLKEEPARYQVQLTKKHHSRSLIGILRPHMDCVNLSIAVCLRTLKLNE